MMGDGVESSSRVGFQVMLFGVLALGLMSCMALPGGSMDPLVPALGLPRPGEGPAQPGREAPVPAGASAHRQSQPTREVQPPGGPPARSEWIGRYRDGRGEGEIALALTQDGGALGGTWRLRTGGSGSFAGTLAVDGRMLSFSMRGGDRECVVMFEGVGEYGGGQISGGYRGTDCHGAVGDGRLDLRKR